MVKKELGVTDMNEVKDAVQSRTWPFQVSPQQLWSKIQEQFDGPVSPMELMNLFMSGKIPGTEGEEGKKGLKEKMMEKMIQRKMKKMKEDMDKGKSGGW